MSQLISYIGSICRSDGYLLEVGACFEDLKQVNNAPMHNDIDPESRQGGKDEQLRQLDGKVLLDSVSQVHGPQSWLQSSIVMVLNNAG